MYTSGLLYENIRLFPMVFASSLYIPMVDTLFLISSSGCNASKWLAIKSTIAIIPTRAIDFAFFILSNIILTKRLSLLFSYINRLLLGLTLFISCFLHKRLVMTFSLIVSSTPTPICGVSPHILIPRLFQIVY